MVGRMRSKRSNNSADVHRTHLFPSSGRRNPIRHDRAALEARVVEVMAKGLVLFSAFLFLLPLLLLRRS